MNTPTRAHLTTFKFSESPTGKKNKVCPTCHAPIGHSCIRYVGKTKDWPGHPVAMKTFHKER